MDLTTPNRPKVSVKAKINEIGKKALERTRELGVRCRSASTNKKSSSGAVKMKSEQFLQKAGLFKTCLPPMALVLGRHVNVYAYTRFAKSIIFMSPLPLLL